MIANPVGFFFFRPFKRFSDFCFDRFAAPLIDRCQSVTKKVHDCALEAMERAKPYGDSLIGRTVKSAATETLCSVVGGIAGQIVVGHLSAAIGPQVVPVVCLVGIAAAAHKKNKFQIALYSCGFIFPAFLSKNRRAELFLQLGQYAGSTMGGILGGYAGLRKLIGCNVELINPTRPSDSYLVNMLKFQAAGEIFDAVIVRSSIPYARFLVNLPRNALKSVCQTLAYNSQVSIPLARKFFKDKKISITIPLAVKMVCSRYCVENSNGMALRMTQMISKTILPKAMESVGGVIGYTVLVGPLRNGIDYLGDNSGRMISILMRGFNQYGRIIKEIYGDTPPWVVKEVDDLVKIDTLDHKANDQMAAGDSFIGLDLDRLEKNLKDKMPGTEIASSIIDQTLRPNLDEWSNSLARMLQEMETEIFGTQILSEEQADFLRKCGPIYMKYYLIYIFLNAQKLDTELTLIEERDFFEGINEAFFAIYAQSTRPSRVAQCLRRTTSFALESLYRARRFFEPSDQETLVAAPIAISDGYFHRARSQQPPTQTNAASPPRSTYTINDEYFNS